MNQNIVVLYASMTGNARDCALDLARHLTREGRLAVARDLIDYPASNILNEQTVFICISTWGEGEPPDDGAEFVDFLRFLDAGTLSHITYSVLALGDSGYPDFCQCGRDVDALLEYLGAKRLVPRVDCDVDYDGPASDWMKQITAALNTPPSRQQAA